MSKQHVIIVAAGKGQRMGQMEIPKPFILLDGLPIIIHTLNRFISAMPEIGATIVLPRNFVHLWNQTMEEFQWHYPHQIVEGGPERFHSVKSGLSSIGDAELVAVHDAVRPFVSVEIIQNGFSIAERHGAAVPCLSSIESIRQVDGALSKPVNRDKFRMIQTPQVFKTSILTDAYRQSYRDIFTDDASVVEAAGYPVRLYDGCRSNIKITEPFDLLIAEMLIKKGF